MTDTLITHIAKKTIPSTGIPTDQIDPTITYLTAIKEILPASRDIEKAFEDCSAGALIPKNNAWIELAVTLKFHNYRGYTHVSQHLTPSLWNEMIDETIARLRVAKEKEIQWWEAATETKGEDS